MEHVHAAKFALHIDADYLYSSNGYSTVQLAAYEVYHWYACKKCIDFDLYPYLNIWIVMFTYK